MAIIWGEYGPYDDATGQPVFGNETVPIGGAPVNTSYITRGDYRLPNQGLGGTQMGGGQLEFKDAGGNWVPVTSANAPSGYDPRQDSNAQGSNERLRFDQAFSNAPADVPITDMQQWAMANGWQEPDRSKNEGTLGAMFSNIAPYAALMAGGIGAMGGFGGGLLGASEGLANTGYIDALGGMTDATGTALGGWGEMGGFTGGGGLDVNKLLGVTNTGEMSYIPGSSLESITGNPSWDAMFGQVAGEGASFPAGFTPSLWDNLKSSLTNPKNAGKLAQALSSFGTTPTMQGGGASMPSFPSSYGGASSGGSGTAPMPQAAQQPLATPQFESSFQPMNVVAPQFTGFQQNNPLSDPFAESHATWAGPQYAKALRG